MIPMAYHSPSSFQPNNPSSRQLHCLLSQLWTFLFVSESERLLAKTVRVRHSNSDCSPLAVASCSSAPPLWEFAGRLCPSLLLSPRPYSDSKIEKKQDGSPLSESMSSISNYFTIFSCCPTAKRCRIVEQLTDSAVYVPPYFLDYCPIVSLHNYNCIDKTASYIQSLFPTGQH